MVLPISTCAPDEPAVAEGEFVSLLFEPHPARARAATPIAAIEIRDGARMCSLASSSAARPPGWPASVRREARLRGNAVDAVGHAEFASAVDHGGRTRPVVDGLIEPVNRDVVDDVLGDDHVRRALNRYAPAGSLDGDVVAGAHDEQRGVVAVERLVD